MNECVTVGSQFTDAMTGDLLEDTFAAREQRDQNAATVVAVSSATDVTVHLKAVDKLDSTVMLEGHTLGERPNSGFFILRHAADGKQEQVLLRLETCRAGDSVAFAKELADSVTKLGEGAVFVNGDISHLYSISYCDISATWGVAVGSQGVNL